MEQVRLTKVAIRLLFTIAVFWLAAGSAMANTISQTISGTITQDDFQVGPWSQLPFQGHLALFDPSLGSLNSIGVNISSTITMDSSNEDFMWSMPGEYPLLSTGFLILGLVGSQEYEFQNAFGYGSNTFTYCDSTITNPDLKSFTGDFIIAHHLGLASYVNGTFVEDIDLLYFYYLAYNENFKFSILNTVTLTYDYSPASVPEPATLLLLGLGLIGLAGVRRKFQK